MPGSNRLVIWSLENMCATRLFLGNVFSNVSIAKTEFKFAVDVNSSIIGWINIWDGEKYDHGVVTSSYEMVVVLCK